MRPGEKLVWRLLALLWLLVTLWLIWVVAHDSMTMCSPNYPC